MSPSPTCRSSPPPEHGVQPVFISARLCEVLVFEGVAGVTIVLPPEVWRSIAEQILKARPFEDVILPSAN